MKTEPVSITATIAGLSGICSMLVAGLIASKLFLEAGITFGVYGLALAILFVIQAFLGRRKADRTTDTLVAELLRHPLFGLCSSHVAFVIDTFEFSGAKRTWAYRTLLKYKFHYVGTMYREFMEQVVKEWGTENFKALVSFESRIEHLKAIIHAYETAAINAGVPEIVVRTFSDKYHKDNVTMIVRQIEDNCRSVLYDDFQRINAEMDIVTVAMRTVIHDIQEMDKANGVVSQALDGMTEREPVQIAVE